MKVYVVDFIDIRYKDMGAIFSTIDKAVEYLIKESERLKTPLAEFSIDMETESASFPFNKNTIVQIYPYIVDCEC